MACGQVEGTCLQGGGQGEGSLQLGREYVFLTLDNAMWLWTWGCGMTSQGRADFIGGLSCRHCTQVKPKMVIRTHI